MFDRDAVDRPLVRNDVEESPGKPIQPVVGFEDERDGLHLAGEHPRIDQLVPGVHLEGVRGIAALHPRGKNHLGVRPRPAGYRGIDELHGGVELAVQVEHGRQSLRLSSGRPPAEDLQPRVPGLFRAPARVRHHGNKGKGDEKNNRGHRPHWISPTVASGACPSSCLRIFSYRVFRLMPRRVALFVMLPRFLSRTERMIFFSISRE